MLAKLETLEKSRQMASEWPCTIIRTHSYSRIRRSTEGGDWSVETLQAKTAKFFAKIAN